MDTKALSRFWEAAKAELASAPFDVELEPIAEDNPTLATYRVRLRSIGGVQIRGIYSHPIWPERSRFPAIMAVPGYGGDMVHEPLALGQLGYAWLTLYPRGQGESCADWTVPEGFTKLTHGLDAPENHYYRAAYMDCVRGLDFLASRPEVDASRLGLYGVSQGGGLTLATAALDDRPSAAVAHVPFLCNYPVAVASATTGPYLELAELFGRAPQGRAAGLQTLSWMDPINLAGMIRCPTLMSVGMVDTTCPPDTIQPVYDAIGCEKSIVSYPQLGHAHSADFRAHARHWFDTYLVG